MNDVIIPFTFKTIHALYYKKLVPQLWIKNLHRSAYFPPKSTRLMSITKEHNFQNKTPWMRRWFWHNPNLIFLWMGGSFEPSGDQISSCRTEISSQTISCNTAGKGMMNLNTPYKPSVRVSLSCEYNLCGPFSYPLKAHQIAPVQYRVVGSF